MHKNTLREISKFLAGLVTGDFLAGWWLYAKGAIPVSILGLQFSSRGIVLGMVFDAVLVSFLVHYGWRIKENGYSSGERLFHRAAGTVFAIVALAHLVRLVFNLPVNLLSWNTPYWVSGIATVVAAFLSYTSFHLTRKK